MPRLSWQLASQQRGQKQSAYRIMVSSSRAALNRDEADIWDSGKVASDESLFVAFGGKKLQSRQRCFWKVQVWDQDAVMPRTSRVASWSMGLLADSDWQADYISHRDESEVFADTESLKLPAARQYRREFVSSKSIRRATVYATALGIYELHVNGKRVGDALFAPGWTDYRQRAYYQTYDVTDLMKSGDNAMGAWVAEGWYSGYVGFGLLTGMSTNKTGRSVYGKTPSIMAQLEIEYEDGTREVIGTDNSWKVTGDGPIQAADLLMGEEYDARKELDGWSSAGFDDSAWAQAIAAEDNGQPTADFFQFQNPPGGKGPVRKVSTKRSLGFRRPKLEAFPGVPVRVIEELPAKSVSQLQENTFIFDMGQNFAGVIRLKVKGKAGQRIRIRYGEMLHPDGRLMTENLRKARATDYYTCKGDPEGEVYQPRFTFHGFQFVELKGVTSPSVNDVTGLVLHSDTPLVSEFECSDPMVNQLFRNIVWTQRANFLDLPTDCPQRDERMGWTGDAQAYVGAAAYNADIGAFYTKWLRELMESQRPSGAFPGYAPYPFQHGWDFGTAWADAGVICPWTIWQVYGDTRVIDDCWEPMTKFMRWRKTTSVDDLGISHGNAWGDWLSQGETTPLDYVDSVYYAISAKMMSEMASATDRHEDAVAYRKQFEATRDAFQRKYLREDGSINVSTQTAQALALFADLIPKSQRSKTARHLADMLAENGNHMATGFLGTRPLLPVLSDSGQNDLAVFLLQSREFPSWGYEIQNGATTIWERWDSYTKEDAFGRHNAAMNSFSHYAFGAVCEWMFRGLAGIQSDGPGYKRIKICPQPPTPGSNAMHPAIHHVAASYDSIRGSIRSEWRIVDGKFRLAVSIPANTTASVYLPTSDVRSIKEGGESIDEHPHVKLIRIEDSVAILSVASGNYEFAAETGIAAASIALKTSKPKDNSINPDGIDLSDATKIQSWDFTNPIDVTNWTDRKNVDLRYRSGHAYVVATGDDSQMAVRLDKPASGKLVIELRAKPENGATSQFFWAQASQGFNGQQQSKRTLRKTDQVNAYLFSASMKEPIRKLRFDPFATYDKYANAGEMLVESITVYRLNNE
ncbi:MAG: glycoside hydrolase family 78 protein [Planctomycetota bacterium]